MNVKDTVGKVTANPIGLLAGAGAGYLAATKLIKTEKMWLKVVSALVGGVVGATVQSKLKAKKGAPTAATVTAPVK